jgi:predicted N-acetyltransferase YhbS
MAVEYGIEKPDERARILDFINMVFSMGHVPHNFRKQLPKVYGENAPYADRTIHFVARGDDTILGNVAILPLELYVNGNTLRTGFVGGVATHPYHRGEGAMKALMRMAEDYARWNGYDMLELGGLRQRYEYYGYKQMGMRRVFEVTKTNVRHALKNVNSDGITITSAAENGFALLDDIYNLHQAQPIRVERPREGFLSIAQSWAYDLLAFTQGGKLLGYAVHCGSKNDCSELVLADYADTRAAVKALLQGRDAVSVKTRGYQKELIKALSGFAEEWRIESELQINILNNERVMQAYPRIFDTDLTLPCALDFPMADMF